MQDIYGVLHKIHCGGKGEKQDNAKGETGRHEKEIFAVCPGMMDAKRCLYLAKNSICRAVHRGAVVGAAAHCCQWRHKRGFSGGSAGGENDRQEADQDSGDNAWQTDGEGGHCLEIFGAQKAQQGAQEPDHRHTGRQGGGNGKAAKTKGFPVHQADDLFWRCADAAEHAEKGRPPGNIAV